MLSRFVLLTSLCLAIFWPAWAWAETISLPIRVEYPMLRSLVAAAAFREPGQRVQVVDEANGCRQVTLSEPGFGEEDGRLVFTTRVAVHVGVEAGGRCVLPVEWDGYLIMAQQPVIDPHTWRLSFAIDSSHLETLERKPAVVAEIVWDIIKKQVYAHLEQISIDLSLPVTEVKAFVSGLFAADVMERTQRLIEGMRPGEISVDRSALSVPILADVQQPAAGEAEEEITPRPPSRPQTLVENWEAWDEFLVSMIASLAPRLLNDDEQQLLLSVLLDLRYQFAGELTAPSVHEDIVRRQFIAAWEQFSPIFRAHLTAGSARTLLGYLAFISASDALAVLDALGPGLGIEVSRAGLLRLVQLLFEGPAVTLAYSPDLNPALRQSLGLDPNPETPPQTLLPGDAPDRRHFVHQSWGVERGRAAGFGKMLSAAWAADSQVPIDGAELEAWIPSLAGAENYRIRVRALLAAAAERSLERSPVSVHFYDLCRRIIPAVAWQESCMRQFTIDNGRVEYLRSYNGSSVGIMQINERVWRGIYDLKRLRWDIQYNAGSGAEIVVLYFHRFLLPKAAKTNPDLVLDEAVLAGLLYAMYNGGPGEFSRYLKRLRDGRLYTSDRLFSEKHEWVEANQWQNLDPCFGG